MTEREALKMAIEFLEDNQHYVADNERHAYVMEYNNVIEKCKEALAQPEPGGVCVRCGGWVCDPIPELAQPEHSCVACEGNPKGNNNPCAVCGLAQPEQEPVAYSYTSRITGAQGFSHHPMPRFIDSESWDIKPLVFGDTSPPHRKPLSDEEIWKFWWSRPEVPEGEDDSMEAEFVAVVRAVLAAHGIKE